MPSKSQWTAKTVCGVLLVSMVVQVLSLSGPNVCMVKQKYNITKRVKYRAPMSIRTYEWCFSMPPRCSKWSTEMRDLTKLETEERTAEVAVCCPGYKMKDVSCVPICPNGKTGHGCLEDCPPNKWGPNCANECGECVNGYCLPTTGECDCEDGWQGESCKVSMPTTQPPPALMEELLTTTKSSIRTVPSTISTTPTATKSFVSTVPSFTPTRATTTTLSTKIPLSTTVKTDKTSISSTLLNKKTSISLHNNFLLTTLTPTFHDPYKVGSRATIGLPTVTKANYNYNRTETPLEGTSVKLISKHDQSTQIKIPITARPQTNSPPLNSTINLNLTTATVIPLKAVTRSPIMSMISTGLSPVIVQSSSDNSETSSSIDTLASTTYRTTTLSTTSNTFSTKIFTTKPIKSQFEISTPIHPTNTFLFPNNNTSIIIPNVPSMSPSIVPSIGTSTIQETTIISTPLHPLINIPNVTINDKAVHINTSKMTLTKAAHTSPSTSASKVTVIMDKEVTEKDTTMGNTRKPAMTTKSQITTIKFKPKEIWIKPTQKGEPTFETKSKNVYELQNKHKSVTTKNEAISESTTPKTIIVSIIPTSLSHATFKKIALTTASYVYQKKNITAKLSSKTDQGYTKSMTSQSTAIPFTIKILPTHKTKTLGTSKTTTQLSQDTIRMLTPTSKKALLHTTVSEKQTFKVLNTTIATSRSTNSMSTWNEVRNLNSSVLTIKPPTNKKKLITKSFESTTVSNKKALPHAKDEAVNKTVNANVTRSKAKLQETAIKILTERANTKNVTKVPNRVTTQEPEHETFHILTEPEHITAVMSDKDRDQTSMDLISVISIAGGVMMTVITVAIIIVMIERCRRPRYDDVNKMSDIRMQVMIDNNDVPPPYVRSIFHAPLPEPPHTDKCHYQPISTLDRNLKQFMRPVVVQSISPVMLENFRGILECHYDHLPRRNHDFGTMPVRGPAAVKPEERRPLSVADYTIEAMRCEAKLDVIDNTTSEPLYAEIPCWRPPSEHAIAVVSLNGEAITEL